LSDAAISGGFSRVRLFISLAVLTTTLHAELIAHFHTTQGVVNVDLKYEFAPQTVANFITLAQGSRPWADPLNGAIRKIPFYNGTKIHRTANNSVDKFAQGGSRLGDGSDGPGYSLKDEFSPSLRHVPYVLSMANSGPNTSGSQFFMTGSLPVPAYDDVYTVFGLVTDPVSRNVVDLIIAAGPNGTTINQVTFSRTDAAAIAFDEHAQNLPEIFFPNGRLTVTPNISAIWTFTPLLISTGEVFNAYYSQTMAPNSWGELDFARLHVGISEGALLFPAVTQAPLDNAAAPKAFYNLYVAKHPGSVAPSYLNGRTVTFPLDEGVLQYQFDNTGVAGTTTFTPVVGTPLVSPFITVNPGNGAPEAPFTDAHSVKFTVDHATLNPRYLWFRIGCDSATNSLVTGRHSTQSYGLFGWQPFGAGPVTITRSRSF
jgi:peptidyl-prolyl cis-trans isomerase A (cyclophilin A)